MKRAVAVPLLVLSLLAPAARAGAAADPVSAVERALQAGRFREALALSSKIAADESNAPALRARALRARAMALGMRLQSLEYAAALEDAVIADPDHPAGPGLLQLACYEHHAGGAGPGWSGRIERLRAAAETHPWLLGAVTEMQSLERRMQGRFDESAALLAGLHPVRDYLVLGPFDDSGGSGIDEVYPVEERLAPAADLTDRHGRPIGWFAARGRADGIVDLDLLFDNEPNAIGYGVVEVRADSAREVVAHLGGGGSFRLWVGDRLVLDEPIVRSADVGFYEIPVRLEAGWNRMLIKLGAEKEALSFSLRFSDPQGRPLALETRTDGVLAGSGPAAAAGAEAPGLPQGTARFPAPAGPLDGPPRPGEGWLRAWQARALQKGAGIADLALLAMDLQVRDLEDDAAAVVDSMRARFPGAPIAEYLRAHVLDAQESEEGDAIRRRLAETAPEMLEGRVILLKRSIEAKDLERTQKELEALLAEVPGEPMLLSMHASMLIARGSIHEGIAEMRRARDLGPGNAAVNGWYAQMLGALNRDAEREQAMREAFAARPDLVTNARGLASVAFRARQYDEALARLRAALATGDDPKTVLAEMAVVQEAAGRPDSAVAALEEAMRRAPMAADLCGQLGDLLLKADRKREALEAMRRRVLLEPTAVETRELIRRLEGKPALRERFVRDDAVALARRAAAPADSGTNVVYLLDAVDVVHYPDGAEEIWHHVVRRVLTREGVDEYGKEGIEGEVELARIIKPDGREIDAETTEGEVAYTGLEPGDVTDVIFRTNDGDLPGLPGAFWRRHYFQLSEPVRLSRFSLLVPDTLRYRSERHNGAPAPRTSTAGGWRLDVWESRDLPAGPREANMPPADERSAWLDISNVPAWDDIVRWYDRVSRQRARATPALRALARRLAEGDSAGLERVRRVVDYVKENVRYEDGSLGGSAHVPRSADAVLRTRYGDCKDQACLIVSLLREMGIPARFALVSGREYQTVPYLPSPRFNHAIVRAGGRGVPEVWVDTTDPDLVFPNVPVQIEGARALVVDPAAPAFVTVGLDSAAWNGCDSRLEGALDASGDMVLRGDCRFVGEDAAGYRSALRRQPERRDQLARELVVQDHPGAEASELVLDAGGLRTVGLTYRLRIPAAAARAGGFLMVRPPWTIETVPHDLVSQETRRLPLLLDDWKGRYQERIRLRLPDGYEPAEERAPVRLDCPVGSFRLEVRDGGGGELVLEKTLQLERVRVEPAEYAAFRTFLTEAWRAEREQLVLRPKRTP